VHTNFGLISAREESEYCGRIFFVVAIGSYQRLYRTHQRQMADVVRPPQYTHSMLL
jgi:hypothetical protein